MLRSNPTHKSRCMAQHSHTPAHAWLLLIILPSCYGVPAEDSTDIEAAEAAQDAAPGQELHQAEAEMMLGELVSFSQCQEVQPAAHKMTLSKKMHCVTRVIAVVPWPQYPSYFPDIRGCRCQPCRRQWSSSCSCNSTRTSLGNHSLALPAKKQSASTGEAVAVGTKEEHVTCSPALHCTAVIVTAAESVDGLRLSQAAPRRDRSIHAALSAHKQQLPVQAGTAAFKSQTA